MIYILFNPKSNNSRGEADAKAWATNAKVDAKFVSVIDLDFKKFFKELSKEDEVILAGGDGTVNRFANDTYGFDFKNPLYYVKCGSGNDFYKDVSSYEKDGKIDLRPFLKNLPLVTANGESHRFLNGSAFGIDGETCEVGDKIRATDPSAKINYSSIAVKLLLGGYKYRKATVEVDGVKHEFKNVWVCSTMKGKYYGGGMLCAPKQDRLNKDNTCTITILSSSGRLTTLFRFPKFSGGQHEGKKWLTSFVGKHIKVTFDIPCALQIDGDVISNVTTYEVDCEK